MPESKTTSPAIRWPADWDRVLDTAIREWGGQWDTKRVQHLFSARYAGDGIFRDAARDCLSLRAHAGLLHLHERPNARYYTLASPKGATS